jgi:hypothetical protein
VLGGQHDSIRTLLLYWEMFALIEQKIVGPRTESCQRDSHKRILWRFFFLQVVG